MLRFRSSRQAVVALMLGAILGSTPAWAGLGQPEASVSTDRLLFKSEENIQTLQGYRVHQLTRTNGPTVREFVSLQGQVVGVAWQGRSVPDMNQLLGTYVANLQTATAAQTHIVPLRGLTVKTGDLSCTPISAACAFVPEAPTCQVSFQHRMLPRGWCANAQVSLWIRDRRFSIRAFSICPLCICPDNRVASGWLWWRSSV